MVSFGESDDSAWRSSWEAVPASDLAYKMAGEAYDDL